jgi:hypothetical protein
VSNSSIPRLCTGPRHGGLPFWRPENQVVSKEDAVAWCRASRAWTSSPVGVRVCCDGWHATNAEVQTGVESALDITQNAFDQRKMRLPWVVESASSPLVGFGWLNDNMIKELTRLLSVDR